jgi:hypothetical protein
MRRHHRGMYLRFDLRDGWLLLQRILRHGRHMRRFLCRAYGRHLPVPDQRLRCGELLGNQYGHRSRNLRRRNVRFSRAANLRQQPHVIGERVQDNLRDLERLRVGLLLRQHQSLCGQEDGRSALCRCIRMHQQLLRRPLLQHQRCLHLPPAERGQLDRKSWIRHGHFQLDR